MEQLPSGGWKAVKHTSSGVRIRIFDTKEEAEEYED